MKKVISAYILIFILLAFSVSAAVSVTYDFYDVHTNSPVNHVDALAYPCNDASCSNLQLWNPVQGSGNSGSSVRHTLVFPTNLVTSHGYAVYYFREGYAPQEYKADWWGTLTTSYSIPFNKVSECKASITGLRAYYDEQDQRWEVQADVQSAFTDTNPDVNHILSGYEDYYSSAMDITLDVFDEYNNHVRTRTITRNIMMDRTYNPVFNIGEFEPGKYTAVATTHVTDDQCLSDVEQTRSTGFEVEDQVYDLDVSVTADPLSGEELLESEITCSVSNGQAPYSYSFYEDGQLVLESTISSSTLSINRVFSEGIYEVSCSVEDRIGMTGTDYVSVEVDSSVPEPECSDGLDNDGDGLVDEDDPGCYDSGVYDPEDDSEEDTLPACSDNFDNDDDGLVDLDDPGCEDGEDDDETDPVTLPECSDGIDNDGDGLVDMDDPGCLSPGDNDETDFFCTEHFDISAVELSGIDIQEGNTYLLSSALISSGSIPFDYYFTNTGDLHIFGENYTTLMTLEGFIASEDTSVMPNVAPDSTVVEGQDFSIPASLPEGTYNLSVTAFGIDEEACIQADDFRFFLEVDYSAQSYACSDGLDNDGDGLVDEDDPGCYDSGVYDPEDDSEEDTFPACSDNFDNDGDGLVDLDDPGCEDGEDDDETDPVTLPECSDGIDNDGDGLVDMDDPDCSSSDDDSEDEDNGGDVPQVALLFPEDGASFQTSQITFIYGVVDDNTPLLECTLYTDITGEFEAYDSQMTANNYVGFFNYSGVPDGTYTWNVECSDGFNSAFAPDNFTFTVDTSGYVDVPAEVSITATPSSGVEDLNVQFHSSVSGNAPIIYSWDFGDGSTSTGANPFHTYDNDGVYTATLTITDADGDTASDSVTIDVTDSGDEDDEGDEDDDNEEDAEQCDLYIGRVFMYSDSDEYGDNYVEAGGELFVNVHFDNTGDLDLEDVRYRALILDLGLSNSVRFDLDQGQDTSRTVRIDIPEDAEPGYYDIQISAHNDCISRTKYRMFTIV
ncbi:PKD domain-containing protein [Candidatus Woesearchaeota archaeon]|nr:PKD domain-containing protein [Candidatus Woesearchaeota archaeon]